MTKKEIREHCNNYGYSDGEVYAFKDGYEQGRADALKPIAKIIDDFACGRIEQSLSALNEINHNIAEQLKEQKE